MAYLNFGDIRTFTRIVDSKGILKDIQEQFVTFLKKELSLVDSFKVDMSRNKNPLYINGVKTLI